MHFRHVLAFHLKSYIVHASVYVEGKHNLISSDELNFEPCRKFIHYGEEHTMELDIN